MTGRGSITGIERQWTTADALGGCPHCAARGPAHDRARCARQAGGPRASGARPAPAADELGVLVLDVLREHGPASGREVQRRVPRRATDVRAALRALEAAGVACRGDDGSAVTR